MPGEKRTRKTDKREGVRKASGRVALRKPVSRKKPPSDKPVPQAKRTSSSANARGRLRIAKAIARAGLCSRREAERWIAEGRVRVNGRVLETPAFEVGSKDKVEVDGNPLPEQQPIRLWRYHKPRGQVTTHKDPEGRPTVFDHLPQNLGRVISVGRLDFNTEGLLLLTTNGLLARYLELPSTGLLRRYRVRARGAVTQEALDALKDGVEIEGVKYGPVEATLDEAGGSNLWLTVGLREGKNREVRKIMQHLGLDVGRLIRISYGPFRLADLKSGEVDIVRRKVLIDQLGPRAAEDLGLVGLDEEDQHRPTRHPKRNVSAHRSSSSQKSMAAKGMAKRAGKPSGKPGREDRTDRRASSNPIGRKAFKKR